MTPNISIIAKEFTNEAEFKASIMDAVCKVGIHAMRDCENTDEVETLSFDLDLLRRVCFAIAMES